MPCQAYHLLHRGVINQQFPRWQSGLSEIYIYTACGFCWFSKIHVILGQFYRKQKTFILPLMHFCVCFWDYAEQIQPEGKEDQVFPSILNKSICYPLTS